MRAFIGIEVSDGTREALGEAVRELGTCGAQVKWVAAANLHLTIKFLGEIDETTAESVKGAMRLVVSGQGAVAGGGFEFEVAGLGCFPPRGTPRVVWAGVMRGADAVTRVQGKLESALKPLGFEQERDFVPHVTLGRVKAARGAEKLLPPIEKQAERTFGVCRAAELVLFESVLTPKGAMYSVVARQTL